MLILLPPSETKARPRSRARGRPVNLSQLSFPELADLRERVGAALEEVSARPDAARVLGVSTGLQGDISRNLRLRSAPAIAVADLYTGVLYEALGLPGLEPAARRRADRWVVVVSALYGAVRPRDRVGSYRLSMGVNLPGVGPLATAWREPLSRVLPTAAGSGVVVDCRSATYAAAWTPRGASAARWVQIRVPGATHEAKRTRGLVARHLIRAGHDARTVAALTAVLAESFDTTLREPVAAGRPWVLDTVERIPISSG